MEKKLGDITKELEEKNRIIKELKKKLRKFEAIESMFKNLSGQ